MISLVIGRKGTGKTKRILNRANSAVETAKGNIVFIDDDRRYMLDLKHEIRFIDASEYNIDSPKMFYGFLCGIVAMDFDLETVFIDGLLRIVKYDVEKLDEFFEHMKAITEKFNINIVASVSAGAQELPEFLTPYVQADLRPHSVWVSPDFFF